MLFYIIKLKAAVFFEVSKHKKKLLSKSGKILIIIFLIIITMAGLIRINILNTRTLSPLGNTKQNYELINEKFGDDFANFIKDDSFLKIYDEHEDGKIIIRIGDNEFKISSKSNVIEYVKDKINKNE